MRFCSALEAILRAISLPASKQVWMCEESLGMRLTTNSNGQIIYLLFSQFSVKTEVNLLTLLTSQKNVDIFTPHKISLPSWRGVLPREVSSHDEWEKEKSSNEGAAHEVLGPEGKMRGKEKRRGGEKEREEKWERKGGGKEGGREEIERREGRRERGEEGEKERKDGAGEREEGRREEKGQD